VSLLFLEIQTMPTFDTVLETDLVKVKNAVENSAKEIGTRFDFKGTAASIELKDKEITLIGDGDFQVEKIGGDKVKQVTKVRDGIETEQAKKIQQLIKGSKIKVQAAIQDGKVRVTGAKRDDLQAAMALIRADIKDLPLSFDNFRD